MEIWTEAGKGRKSRLKGILDYIGMGNRHLYCTIIANWVWGGVLFGENIVACITSSTDITNCLG